MRDSGFLLGNDNISLVFFHHHESQIIDSFHISFHSALTKIALILQSDAVELAPSTVKTTVVFFSSSVELIYDVQEKKVDYIINTFSGNHNLTWLKLCHLELHFCLQASCGFMCRRGTVSNTHESLARIQRSLF